MKNQKKLFLFFNFYDKINVVNVKYQTRGGIKVGLLKKILSNDEDVFSENITGDEYYDLKPEEALKENDGSTKMILLEPRAYSEAQQIADHLKMRNTVVVNLKRVTSDQAKRIIDFLAGTIYAIVLIYKERLQKKLREKTFTTMMTSILSGNLWGEEYGKV